MILHFCMFAFCVLQHCTPVLSQSLAYTGFNLALCSILHVVGMCTCFLDASATEEVEDGGWHSREGGFVSVRRCEAGQYSPKSTKTPDEWTSRRGFCMMLILTNHFNDRMYSFFDKCEGRQTYKSWPDSGYTNGFLKLAVSRKLKIDKTRKHSIAMHGTLCVLHLLAVFLWTPRGSNNDFHPLIF